MNIEPFYLKSITTQCLDLPLLQPIKMSFGNVEKLNVVLIRVRDQEGRMGIGEASVLGGPYWGSDSVESIQAVIERYIAPALVRFPITGIEATSTFLSRLIRGNGPGRSGVEMAVLDLLGRRLNTSSINLLGGCCRSQLPVAWTLSTGSLEGDVEEGERAILARGHRRFKVKLGRENIAADVARVASIVDAFNGRATVIADVNQGWDLTTALRYLPQLQEAGLEAIEQPLLANDLEGAARLAGMLHMDVIADEALTDSTIAFSLAARRAVTAFALKPNRDGGVVNSRRLSCIAQAARIKLYGGTALETSIGTAASALLYGSLPELQLGSELFGPHRVRDDLTLKSLTVVDGMLQLPDGIGLGVELDEHRILDLVVAEKDCASRRP
ncbi:muconate/chloromuconate family cycloisomerase [Pseudomonas mediterranea]|uniref:muconate/chloromuconate family cycloisomerase n=1 Tax=Pseudomonas mediterranea TaxID=183795 RepID=UPI0006D8AAA5|nr:muconate/chloromuconate family cycloisomerase [Pseudomonas mediterranea]